MLCSVLFLLVSERPEYVVEQHAYNTNATAYLFA